MNESEIKLIEEFIDKNTGQKCEIRNAAEFCRLFKKDEYAEYEKENIKTFADSVYSACMHLDWRLFESVSDDFRKARIYSDVDEIKSGILNAIKWFNETNIKKSNPKPLYDPVTQLDEDEYILKIDKRGVGFLTKLTQKGEIPKAFLKFGEGYSTNKLPIYLHKEEFTAGWSYVHARYGESRSWIRLRHPEGFIVEIYAAEFDKMINNIHINHGVLDGEFKWTYGKLIQKI